MSVHFHIHYPVCEKLTDLQYDSFADIDKILFAKTKEFNCDSYHLEFIALCSDCQIKIKQSIPKDKLPPISLI